MIVSAHSSSWSRTRWITTHITSKLYTSTWIVAKRKHMLCDRTSTWNVRLTIVLGPVTVVSDIVWPRSKLCFVYHLCDIHYNLQKNVHVLNGIDVFERIVIFHLILLQTNTRRRKAASSINCAFVYICPCSHCLDIPWILTHSIFVFYCFSLFCYISFEKSSQHWTSLLYLKSNVYTYCTLSSSYSCF